MANGGRIDYSIGFNVDKTGLNQIKSSLQEIKNLTAQDLMKIGGHTDIQKAENELKALKTSIGQIDGALEKAFNTDLGTLNVSKFNQALKGMNLSQVYKDFSAAGAAGQAAFRNVTSQILTTNMQLKQTHNFLNNMATTMANTVKWGVASSVMNNFTGSVQKAYGYVKSLDTSLNDIRIVTGKSADEMERFATKANNAAKELGKSTTDYTKASLIYYQQGLSDEDVAARAETTLKAANVTGQSGEAVSEQLTAVWNGYKVSAQEAELYIDKLAAVAATTAADLEELSTGMSKVASAADLMGVDIDQLNAQMATIVSVTRQAPESVGTALKTIYARMGDIESGLDAETTLGHYTEEMKAMGVNVLDANGKLRDMGSVIEEIGGKWQSMSREQQIALSQIMAGTRQYNNLLSLFDNWDMYTKALDTSAKSAGTLQKQQDIYMESTQAHLNQLRAASEDLYDSLLDPKGINPVIDGLTTITNLMSNFVDSIGGGGNVLLALGSIGTKVFSQQLATGIATFITNLQNAKENANQLRAELEITQQYQTANLGDSQVGKLVEMKQRVLDLNKSITNEERNIANEYISQQNALYQQQDDLNTRLQQAKELYSQVNGVDSSQIQDIAYKDMAKSLNKAAGELEQYKAGIKETDQAYRSLVAANKIGKDTVSDYANILYKAKEETQANVDSASTLVKELDLEEGSRKRLVAAIEEYNKVTKNGKDIDLDNIAVTEAAKEVREAYANALEKTQTKLKNSAGDLENYSRKMRDNAQASSELQRAYNNFVSGIELRAKIQESLQLVSSFGQLASAMTSIGRIGSIWSNESLTGGEKLLQTITSLSFAAPMLVNSLGKIIPVQKALNAAYAASIPTLIQKHGIEISMGRLTSKGITQETAFTATMAMRNASAEVRNQLEAVFLDLEARVISAETAQTTINKILTGSNYKLGFSALFTAQGLKAMWGSLGLAGQATVVIAAIAGVVKVFDWLTISAKEAGEQLEKSIEFFNNTKSELESLESELQTTKERMEELLSLDELSITDKEELAELEKQNAELEVQIELLKQKQKLESQQIAKDARETVEKGTYGKTKTDKDFAYRKDVVMDSVLEAGTETKGKTATYYGGTGTESINTSGFKVQKDQLDAADQSTFDSWKKDMQNLYKVAMDNAEEATGFGKKAWKKIADKIDKDIVATEIDYNNKRLENAEELEEGYLKGQEALPHLRENNIGGINDEAIAYFEDITKQYYESMGTFDSLVTGAIENLSISTNQENALMSTEGLDSEQDIIDIIGEESFNSLKEYSELLGVSVFDIIERFQEMNGLLGATAEEIAKKKEEIAQEKRNELVETVKTDYADINQESPSGGIQTSDFEQAGFTAADLDNWATISQYLDENIVKTKGWTEALKEAKTEAASVAEETESNQRLGKAAEEYDLDADELKNYRDLLAETEEAVGMTAEAIDDAAVTNKRMEKGIKTLAKNWDDLNEIMSDSESTAEDISSVMTSDVQEALQEILDIDTEQFELLPPDFAQKNWNLIQDAVNGVEGGVEALRNAAQTELGEDLLLEITPQANMDAFGEEINRLNSVIAEYDTSDFQVGVSLDPVKEAEFYGACQSIINAAGMTQQEATRYFGNMGYDVEFDNQPQSVSEVVWEKHITTKITKDEDGNVTSKHDSVSGTPKVLTGTVDVPTIKTITPNGSFGGGKSIKNSAPKSAKKSGGSGGGKNGGSTATKTTKDKTTGSVDRYRKVNNELDELANRFEKLAQAQERLFGKDLYNNLTKQLDVLNKQIKVSKQKLEIAKAEKKELQDQLKNKGFKFDKDGEISNYATRVKYFENKVNDAKTKFNNLSAKDQEGSKGEALEKSIEKWENKLDEVLDLIDDYDEVMDTIDEVNDAIVEAAYQKIELKVQKFKLSVELRLDASEAIKDLADFKEMIYDSGESLKKTLRSAVDVVKEIKATGVFGDPDTGDDQIVRGLHHKITNTIKALDAIDKGIDNEYSSKYILKNNKGEYINEDGEVVKKPVFNEALAMETLEELTEELVSELEYVYDVYDQTLEGIVTTTDDVIEAHNKYRDALEEVQSVLEHAMNMVTMISGEDAYADIGAVITAQLQQTEKQLQKEMEASSTYEAQKASLQTDIDSLSNKIATQQAIVDDESKTADEREEASIKLANLEKERAALQEAYDMYDEALQDSYANQREYVEQYTQLLIQQYENTVAQASKTFTSTLIGNLNMEGAQYEWDNLAREEEKYLDTVNKAYELKSLENKINESINSTDSLSAQKRLNQFKEEELKKLREKDKLTQYDVDRANQLYEIELKKIALEEAQNNKSKMRLRRDSSGNYSYQFVADEDNVADAQQELDDAVNSLYNMDKDQYKQELQELQNLHQEYEDFRTWYSQQSAEFRAANQDWYVDQCKIYEQQMIDSAKLAEDTKVNMVQSANLTMLESSKFAQDEITLYTTETINQLVPMVDSAFGKMSSAINGDENSFRANSEAAMKAVTDASEALDQGLTHLAQTIGGDGASKEDLTTLTSNYYTEAIAGANTYAEAQSNNIAKTLEEAAAVRDLAEEMRKLLNTKTLLNSVQAVEDSYEFQEDRNTEEANKIDGKKTTTTKKKSTTTKKPTTTTKKTTKKKEDKLTTNRKKGIAAAIYYDGASESGWGNNPKREERLKSIFGKKGQDVQEYLNTYWSKLQSGKKNPITDFYNDKDGKLSAYHYDSAKKYDTGGYTGSWGSSEGRWAILHEKELILNKKDTENLLTIIKIVRDLASTSSGGDGTKAMPDKLQKDFDKTLEKLDNLYLSLVANNELQKANEKSLNSISSVNENMSKLTVQEIVKSISSLQEDFIHQSSIESQEIVKYLEQVQEYFNAQINEQDMQNNFIEIYEGVFNNLKEFLSIDLISNLEDQVESFKKQIIAQQEKGFLLSENYNQQLIDRFNELGKQIMQNVQINAEFPNVIDSNEIRIALENIENDASQYIHRNVR